MAPSTQQMQPMSSSFNGSDVTADAWRLFWRRGRQIARNVRHSRPGPARRFDWVYDELSQQKL